jgi:hypothetical protein
MRTTSQNIPSLYLPIKKEINACNKNHQVAIHDLIKVPIMSITRSMTKRIKKTFNELIQDI